MQMDEGLDTGAALLVDRLPITTETTASSLHDALSAMGARLIVEALSKLALGQLTAVPQPAEGVTYAAKLSKDEGRLDWSRPAEELERMVRAFTPWPGAWFDHAGERFKVLAAEVVSAGNRPAVLDRHLTVACGDRALRLLRLQRSGKAAMEAEAFLRGYRLDPDTRPGPIMPRYKLTIEYDGTSLVGWQRQDNGLSVQALLEEALQGLCGQPTEAVGAGRTDAGVHATGQVAHIDLPRAFKTDQVRDGLNFWLGGLSAPVAVLAAQAVPANFHARFSAIGRRYLYRIVDRRPPPILDRHRVLWVHRPLDVQAMRGGRPDSGRTT